MSQFQGGGGAPQLQFAAPKLTPWVKRLLIANAAVFLFVFMLGFFPSVQYGVMRFFGLDPELWRSGIPAVWQPFTYAFLHSPDGLGHLARNMLLLYFLGTMLEDVIGPRRFIVQYMGAAVAGAVLHLVAALVFNLPAWVVGASGATMGIVVAVATMRPHTTILLIFIPVPLWGLAAFLVAVDVFALISQLQSGSGDGVAHLVHLGGALFGFLSVRRRWIEADPIAALERKRAVGKAERAIADEARLDQILAKISKTGIGSLSKAEASFLKKRSKGRGETR